MHQYAGRERETADALRRDLESLRRAWERLDAPIVDALAPGITPEEVESLAAPYGLSVPTELKVLWEWHNGVTSNPSSDDDLSIGPGGYDFFSVQTALRAYVQNRELHAEPPDEAPRWSDMYWHRSWLPFMEQGPQRLYVDCDRGLAGRPGATPIRLVTWAWEAYNVDIASSLRQAVRTWVWLLDQDFYRIAGQGSRTLWDVDYLAIPLFLRTSGLA